MSEFCFKLYGKYKGKTEYVGWEHGGIVSSSHEILKLIDKYNLKRGYFEYLLWEFRYSEIKTDAYTYRYFVEKFVFSEGIVQSEGVLPDQEDYDREVHEELERLGTFKIAEAEIRLKFDGNAGDIHVVRLDENGQVIHTCTAKNMNWVEVIEVKGLKHSLLKRIWYSITKKKDYLIQCRYRTVNDHP